MVERAMRRKLRRKLRVADDRDDERTYWALSEKYGPKLVIEVMRSIEDERAVQFLRKALGDKTE